MQQTTNGLFLLKWIKNKEWDKVRQFLTSSDEEDGTNLSLELIQRAVMAKDQFNQTALHYVCVYGASVDVIKMLVDIGGEELVMAKDKDNWTAMHYACRYGASVDIIKMLVDIGGEDLVTAKNVNNNNNTALHYACDKGASVDVIRMLVDIGGEELLMAKDENNDTALHIACWTGASVDVIKMLVDIGGKDLVMAKDEDNNNNTALHYACDKGASVDVIKMLVDIGGEELLMAKNKDNYTALHLACLNGASVDVIKMLVDIGGKELVMAKCNGNRTALHDLCEYGASVDAHIIEVVDVFVNSGVSPLVLFTAEAIRGDELYSPIHFLMENKLENKNVANIHFLMKRKMEKKDVIPIKAILHLQSLWYEKDPLASNIPDSFSKTLQKIQNLSNDDDRDKILEGSFIRAVLNQKVVKVASLFVLFTDLFMQVALMVAFSVLVKSDQKISESVVAILVPSFVWFGCRELTQLLSSNSTLLTYSSDPSNYMDLLQIGLVLHALISFSNNVDPMMLIVCIGVSWLRLVFISANLIYNVSVFVSALVAVSPNMEF